MAWGGRLTRPRTWGGFVDTNETFFREFFERHRHLAGRKADEIGKRTDVGELPDDPETDETEDAPPF